MENTLRQLRDIKYREFQTRLIPNIDPDTIIGVRTPQLRALAKKADRDFLTKLPHRYFEENQIHAFCIESIKDFDTAVREVERFLPYIDNWATCDQLRPKIFGRYREQLLPYIRKWLASDHPYSVRFAMEMLMCHYLTDSFDSEYPALVARSSSDDYYVRMMAAWYFATALGIQYEAVLPWITGYRLDKWIHNRTIQKAAESHRLTRAQKEYLKRFRIRERVPTAEMEENHEKAY